MRPMIFWPVPHSYTRVLPTGGCQGAFWENRLDRSHAGVDIYAPHGSEVLVVEAGHVIQVRVFTSPEILDYWNTTYSVLVQHADRSVCRYAEMADAAVQVGQAVLAGQRLGSVGLVLNTQKVNAASPLYIQKLVAGSLPSMLHFELHSAVPEETPDYLGGNYFNGLRPATLMDPTGYLASAAVSNV